MPLAEHDLRAYTVKDREQGFNSRAPRGARRMDSVTGLLHLTFQFTCPSRSTTGVTDRTLRTFFVSIHVPLAEHDRTRLMTALPVGRFQFTCPSRSTTEQIAQVNKELKSFNSRAPRGARRETNPNSLIDARFQFTCPSRSTTNPAMLTGGFSRVSIHVPLAEHDFTSSKKKPFWAVSIHVPLAEHDRSQSSCKEYG